jgi:hypothetical protein
MLVVMGLSFVVPFKCNSVLFEAGRLKTGDRSVFDGYFMFTRCPIWCYRFGVVQSEGVVVFLDEALKCEGGVLLSSKC